MKKTTLSIALVAALSSISFAGGAIVPVPVVVEDAKPYYVGFGIAAVSNRDAREASHIGSVHSGQDRTANLTLMAGYDYNEYIAVEGRYTTSVAKEHVIKMSGWSIFAKPQYIFDKENGEKGNFSIYGLLGFGGVKMEGISSWIVDVDDTGFQWGVGISYSLRDHLDGEDVFISAEYTELARDFDGLYFADNVKADADAYMISVNYRF